MENTTFTFRIGDQTIFIANEISWVLGGAASLARLPEPTPGSFDNWSLVKYILFECFKIVYFSVKTIKIPWNITQYVDLWRFCFQHYFKNYLWTKHLNTHRFTFQTRCFFTALYTAIKLLENHHLQMVNFGKRYLKFDPSNFLKFFFVWESKHLEIFFFMYIWIERNVLILLIKEIWMSIFVKFKFYFGKY